jgi:hypothetical protein
VASAGAPLSLADYPRPAGDNGRGVHWIPTTGQSRDIVDEFVGKAQAMGMRWVTFLNRPDDLTGNEYLVQQLKAAGIMPVMRIYSEGGEPIDADLTRLARHYTRLGVSYFQIYNEPNLRAETGGQDPDAGLYVSRWLDAARQIVRGGGLPGIGGLSPQGEADDDGFLRQALEELKDTGAGEVLDRLWVSVHNYGRDHLCVLQYDDVVRSVLGRSLPLVGTEAGIYPDEQVTPTEQLRVVREAYDHMQEREPYYFAYSLWVIANEAGGGRDPRWESQALYRTDGATPLAEMLELDAAG